MASRGPSIGYRELTAPQELTLTLTSPLQLLGTQGDISHDQENGSIGMPFWRKQLSPREIVQQFILSVEAGKKC